MTQPLRHGELYHENWIGGLVPQSKIKKLGHLFDLISSGTTPATDRQEYYDGDIPWITTSELRETLITAANVHVTRQALADHSALRIYDPGTLLIAMYGATIGRLGILGIPAATNQACCAMSRPNGVDTKYIYYALLAGREVLIEQASGGGQPNINQEKIRAFKLPAPPLDFQIAVGRFLDSETASIDVLISSKQRLLDLLAEKRRAIVTEAVMRGLNHAAPLRPSGVDWLGKIPTHWEAVPLRFLVSFSGGATPDTRNLDYWNGKIPWVSPKDMKRDFINDAEDHVSEAALHSSALKMIDPDAILIVVRGMILAHSFPTAINTVPVTINQDMKALRCAEQIAPAFLMDVLKGAKDYLVSLADSSAHGTKKLETEALGRFEVPVPPLAEQHEIVRHIATEAAKIDTLCTATERSITLLKERRAALIAAAVTGQVEIPGAA